MYCDQGDFRHQRTVHICSFVRYIRYLSWETSQSSITKISLKCLIDNLMQQTVIFSTTYKQYCRWRNCYQAPFMIRHHWLRWWPGPIRQQIVPWTNVDQVWWHEMLPTGVIGLSLSMLNGFFFGKQIHVCVCLFYYSLTLKLCKMLSYGRERPTMYLCSTV